MALREREQSQDTPFEKAAGFGIVGGMLFWGLIFFLSLEPAHPIEYALVVFMSIGYGLLLPLLANMLLPITSAGQLLQQTRWRTVGFITSVLITVFMLIQAYVIIESYMLTKAVVVEQGNERWFALGLLVVFVFFPALAMRQVMPERWLSEMKMAQAVERYKLASEARLAVLTAAHAIEINRLRRLYVNEFANVAPADIEAIRTHLLTLHQEENQSLEQVVACMDTIVGRDTGVSVLKDKRIRETIDLAASHLYEWTDQAAKERQLPAPEGERRNS